jgi:hypothetical protein
MNPFSLLLIGGGGTLLYKLLSLKKAGDELSISVGAIAITNIKNSALNGWAEIWYDNFTATELHIQQPTVKVFLEDETTEIGHAIPSGDITTVPANGRNEKPGTINFTIPLSNIVFAIPALMAGKKANRKIILRVETVFNGIPYHTDKTYTI